MNKKGFTLIELITTFALVTTIIVILINIIVLIRNLYTQNEIKSSLIIEQSTLSNLINEKFDEDTLISYNPCNDSEFCYNFGFSDGTTSKLIVNENTIKFDSYVYSITEGTKIGDPTLELIDVEVSTTEVNNSFLVIKIPITNKLYPKQAYGINIVYQYNSNKITL